jgi:thiol-disulfide isomerase/thioredoxin
MRSHAGARLVVACLLCSLGEAASASGQAVSILAPSGETLTESATRELLVTGDYRRVRLRGPNGDKDFVFRSVADLRQVLAVPADPLFEAFDKFREDLLGKAVPPFEARDLAGRVWSNESLLGRPAVLNFWFTGCGPCLSEIPALNRLVEDHRGSSAVFLALTFDQPEVLTKFLQEHPFDYSVAHIEKGWFEEIGSWLWPTHIVIDSAGVVRHVVGATPPELIYEILARDLRVLLEKPPPNQAAAADATRRFAPGVAAEPRVR